MNLSAGQAVCLRTTGTVSDYPNYLASYAIHQLTKLKLDMAIKLPSDHSYCLFMTNSFCKHKPYTNGRFSVHQSLLIHQI